MMDVTMASFEAEVIEASMHTHVLLDFWAPWCGPCKVIGPLLEKIEAEYAGRFKLVKINSDDEQQLSAAFGIRSIPTCILMKNGQPVDGFMGALPEGQIKAFLDKHLPAADDLPQENEAETDALHSENAEAAPQDKLAKLKAALDQKPDDDNARFDYLQACILAGELGQAGEAFAPVAPKVSIVRRFESIRLLLSAMNTGASPADLTAEKALFDSKISANRRDFEARFAYSCALLSKGQYTAAMDELLEILMRDKTWNEDAARKLYVAILDLIEPPAVKVEQGQIPPQDPVVAGYRRRLSSVVLS